MARDLIKLVCTSCGEENYHTTKNKKTHPDKVELEKYCSKERKYTLHKEKK
jgi:large subunit ribosomal protein L33